VRNRSAEAPPNEIQSVYKYEIKIKNAGDKIIRALICDYIFFETSTKQEIGRIRFKSTEKLHPGKSKKLVIWTDFPPSKIISAIQSSSQLREQYYEQVIVQSIEYNDNSTWKLPVK